VGDLGSHFIGGGLRGKPQPLRADLLLLELLAQWR
jgi:hypothetical protein